MTGSGLRPHHPDLPPGFVARMVSCEPLTAAIEAAAAGADPASVFYAPLDAQCRAAITLAPDRPISSFPALKLGTLALHDTLAALAPTHIPVWATDRFTTVVNAARVGGLTLHHPPAASDEVPDWAVLRLDVAVDLRLASPGTVPDETCLAEEGFDPDGLAAAVLEGFCRNLLSWTDRLREDGEPVLDEAWEVATAMREAVP